MVPRQFNTAVSLKNQFNTKEPLLSSPPNPSVQHKKSSGQHTRQFNTRKPSVQHTRQFHTNASIEHTPQFNTRKLSFQHIRQWNTKNVSSTLMRQFNTWKPSVKHIRQFYKNPSIQQKRSVQHTCVFLTKKLFVLC